MIVIPAIIVVVSAVVLLIRMCKKKRRRQREIQEKNKEKPSQVVQNKTLVEENSDPLYQDDIQYSEQTDQYYMHPDEVIKPRTQSQSTRAQTQPPPLPSAPIPTIERENEYNDPALNPAIRLGQITDKPRIMESRRGDETEYEGGAYNNIPGVVHTIRPGSNGGDGDEVLQIKFTEPSNIYVNKQ